MTHPISITNGGRSLAFSLLGIPEQFKTPAEIIRAAVTADLLTADGWRDAPGQGASAEDVASYMSWAEQNAPVIELTEKQRDLLKASSEKFADKIPPNRHSRLLLQALGFE